MSKIKNKYHEEIMYQQKLEEIRKQLCKYIQTEGCACCQNVVSHKKAQAALGELLDIPKYPDNQGGGYNWYSDKTN